MRGVRGIIGEEPRDAEGEGGGGLWILGGCVEGKASVKHHWLVVWSDPTPWTVHNRLISSSSERGSNRDLAVL